MSRSVPVRAAAVTGVVVALLATATACGGSAADDKDPEQHSFSLHGRTLTVDSDDSALEIVSADGVKAGTVQVTRWFKGSVLIGDDPHVTWSMKNDRLVLRLKCSGIVTDCDARHRIEVPRGVAVKVRDGNGSVRAQGFKDPLTVRTSNGPVHITDSTGPLDLRTSNGSVRAEVAARQVRTTTSNGSVHLELGAVPDLVDTHSSNGPVTVALPGGRYRVTTETSHGSTHVSVPRDDSSPHVVSARTSNGSITVRTAN
ncbi:MULTISPECIES: DUF4097 family beta strand repeat-containing protein [unclassified Streptomyces]|uniref:DUF4097 family beta strand repeat-containing protein n=1 Tax=unclassified Streptomyces TaxID=2593676 RepID=UPI0007DD7E15|nr:DUF4097 family beta strand repeat-containing protein [Streptomyces sp. SAT1]ANH91329.1 hypothetical protein A8713_09180 [Streptomyces sp. SAT1]